MSRAKAQELLTECLGPFGRIKFPYHPMGRIDSLDLFGPSELMILKLYWDNQTRWKNVLDIGANLGLHSILMSKLGWQVRAFEPDPEHFPRLLENLDLNRVMTVAPFNVAVHTYDGDAMFVRVLNNLTGNHIEGYKDSYGPRESVSVKVVNCRNLWDGTDFAKIDSEGNEAELCATMTAQDMAHMDAIMEVRNVDNALKIMDHFQGIDVPMWSQKIDWHRVQSINDMPHKNREGSLFVGRNPPWM